ncbi:MAG: S8 family serine peptidase [Thermoleophilia bacterium]|nr:S8 family serine peptidase [Thermoleophilia bacterium]
MLKLVLAAVLTAAALAAPALAFDNTEPLADKQWYLTSDNAWTYWPTTPKLFPVNVAVIDSGIDGNHPDLVGRVVAARSFVGGSPSRDDQGHGTFIACLIGANPANNEGIAGLAINARLMIAKVVDNSGTISLEGEVAAIRWAVDNGARVINLSLGGVRDPLNPKLDTYSPLEQAAVEYAYSRGVVVVAAVGNGPQSPATPWGFAHYPAALPHVIGVSAIRQDGVVPDYSNRDAIYNDIAAPGASIFSTIPQQLVSTTADCASRPYSDCGPNEFQEGIGTSFAAPQVSAAAALLLGQDPALKPDQVSWLLERSADDATTATGCAKCTAGRDIYTGWGRLDVLNALTMLGATPLPATDHYEPNDDAGPWAHALPPLPRTISASLDFWDDNTDVYRVTVTKGARLFARLSTPAPVQLALWAPGTKRVELTPGAKLVDTRVARSRRIGRQLRLAYRAPATGVYYLEAKLVSPVRNPVEYRLSLTRH